MLTRAQAGQGPLASSKPCRPDRLQSLQLAGWPRLPLLQAPKQAAARAPGLPCSRLLQQAPLNTAAEPAPTICLIVLACVTLADCWAKTCNCSTHQLGQYVHAGRP